ncbi:MAG TPA: hypothetical protein VHV77_02500 [Pirellulales bacterium]|nr:hypothetical protein [Pirellulales bacterium]
MRTGCLIAATIALWSATSLADDLQQDLQALRSVGAEGQGNEAASRAWKKIVAGEGSDLTAVLKSLDTANPLAANWIAAAFETIADAQLASGSLSSGELEAFVKATDQSPRARRLAFEWLERVDPQAPDRLIPGFIDDPSLELRREAVARLLDEGESLVGTATKAGEVNDPRAIALLRKAFDAARDEDQIERAAKKLKELGQDVDLTQHYGFITTWKLIGPFDNTNGKGFDVAEPPERAIDFAASYPGKKGEVSWIDQTTTDPHGMVDLNAALGKDNDCTGYAAAEFFSSRQQNVDLRVGCICACKFWLNGQLLGQSEVYHSGESIDQYRGTGVLKPGKNVVLIKVCQNNQPEKWAQDWHFQLRVCDAIGTAVHSKL